LLGAVNLTLGPEFDIRLPERFCCGRIGSAPRICSSWRTNKRKVHKLANTEFVLHKLVGYVASQTFEICITLKGTCTEFVFVQYDGMEFAVFVHVVKLT